MEQERRTFRDVHDLDVPCFAPCGKDAPLVVIGRFNGDDVPERGELGRKGQKEGDMLRRGEDDREVGMIDARFTSVKTLVVCAKNRLTRILTGKLEPWLKRAEA